MHLVGFIVRIYLNTTLTRRTSGEPSQEGTFFFLKSGSTWPERTYTYSCTEYFWQRSKHLVTLSHCDAWHNSDRRQSRNSDVGSDTNSTQTWVLPPDIARLAKFSLLSDRWQCHMSRQSWVKKAVGRGAGGGVLQAMCNYLTKTDERYHGCDRSLRCQLVLLINVGPQSAESNVVETAGTVMCHLPTVIRSEKCVGVRTSYSVLTQT